VVSKQRQLEKSPAICCTRGAHSEPRPKGPTPEGWSCESDDQSKYYGKYYCRGCTLGNQIPDWHV